MARFFLSFFILWFLPLVSHAVVVINEVAWMGTAVSANDEWIELYNSGGDPIDITGWTLSGGSLSITLSGTVSGNSYFLLERTDDSTVPGATADQIFTGAISNSGMVLQLKNIGGTVVDSVDGSGDWAIGGDNTTKDTLQKSGGGWVTAPATPRVQNAAGSSSTPPPQQGGATGTASGSGGGASAQPLPEKRISANAGSDKYVIVGADTVFEGMAHGLDGSPLHNARYVWNFGDGSVKEGKRVLHRFVVPGEYVVMLSVSSGEYAAGDRLEVVASEAQLSIPFADATRIEIQNNSASEIDIGRWYLAVDGKTFSIPEHTIIPSNKRLLLSTEITGMTTVDSLALHYPNGTVAFTKNSVGEIADAVSETVVPQILKSTPSVAVKVMPSPALVSEEDMATATPADMTIAAAADASSSGGFASILPWFLGALALVGAAAAGIFLTRTPLPEDEFEIEEG